MNLSAVMDEVAVALKQITGLNVFAYPPDTLTGPAGYVSYPQSIDFDQTYDRGADQFTDLPIALVAGKANTLAARNKIAGWASGSGPDSIKKAIEARKWTSCDDVSIGSAEFDLETIGGQPWLAVIFKATVVGDGEE